MGRERLREETLEEVNATCSASVTPGRHPRPGSSSISVPKVTARTARLPPCSRRSRPLPTPCAAFWPVAAPVPHRGGDPGEFSRTAGLSRPAGTVGAQKAPASKRRRDISLPRQSCGVESLLIRGTVAGHEMPPVVRVVPLFAAAEPEPHLQHQAGPAASVTGAVHEHCPPGWNGSPTCSDHRPARSATIAGRPAIQPLTPLSRCAVSARYLGTAKAVTNKRC
jgi:hypothetical protein